MATTLQPTPTESTQKPTTAQAFGVTSAQSPIAPMTIERRALRPEDVAIRITYCGICHSDLHMAHNDWGMSVYPMVPGHEIVGEVTGVGSAVTKFKVGDRAAVGCLVDSAQTCEHCKAGHEQFCPNWVMTYGSKDLQDGSVTYGGYSDHVVVRQEFVCRLPEGLDISRAAPLLCAGITTYSPLRKFGVGPGRELVPSQPPRLVEPEAVGIASGEVMQLLELLWSYARVEVRRNRVNYFAHAASPMALMSITKR
jgi:uncharacterized zinc-type alcohol dehydrogenase-like protein